MEGGDHVERQGEALGGEDQLQATRGGLWTRRRTTPLQSSTSAQRIKKQLLFPAFAKEYNFHTNALKLQRLHWRDSGLLR